ncbi:SpdD-like protein [Streptomyces subrutilus]|uniref:SpdD-like protein n=1 Tax=Streptomyces subrutilus TaxID=36818 RepID=UPI002E0E6769|nr:SpdD-like protein [Streptomyces subrutilus]
MLRPRIPVNPAPTSLVAPLVNPTTGDITYGATAVPACDCQHVPVPAATESRVQLPAIRLTPAGLVAVVAGGAGLVLVVGAVLVSMLLAVAITGASVAVCAVVLRSLLNGQNQR